MARYCAIKTDGVGSVLEKSKFRWPVCFGQHCKSTSHSFFQAEDGIRDVERSRGLGDVYKRQESRCQIEAQNILNAMV